jgi:hypothetical protein
MTSICSTQPWWKSRIKPHKTSTTSQAPHK